MPRLHGLRQRGVGGEGGMLISEDDLDAAQGYMEQICARDGGLHVAQGNK